MILPFSGMGVAEAKVDEIKYTKSEIDKSFRNSEGYVSYENKNNQMKVDINKMIDDGIENKDIKIMSEWAELHNKVMIGHMNGDKEKTGTALFEAANGPFSYLVNAKTTKLGSVDDNISNVSYVTPISYWSLSACGITYGTTEHSEPPIEIYLHSYPDLSSAQTVIENDGYYQVQWPWIDFNDGGKVYAKINTTGYGDCTSGEFRDENHIYDVYNVKVNHVWYKPVLSLVQVNEPNPDLAAYSAPTFWWDVYVATWHYGN